MYAWLWDKLPGPAVVKLLIALALFLAAVAVLFLWVFPWVDTVLPLQDVSIDGQSQGGG